MRVSPRLYIGTWRALLGRSGRLFVDFALGINHSSLNYSIPFPLFSTGSHAMPVSAVPSSSASTPSTSHSDFSSIFNAALEKYERKTKQDLAKHPLLPRLQSCDSPEAVIIALREQTIEFNQSQNRDDGLTKWVTPTVNVLYSFSSTLGGVVGLVSIRISPHDIVQSRFTFQEFPPVNIIFTGIGALLMVRLFRRSLAGTILIPRRRRLKMPTLAETNLSTSSTA